MKQFMLTFVGMLALVLVTFIPLGVRADGDDAIIAQFDAGIGVNPISGLSSGVPVSNVVRGVAPGGVLWYIGKFQAWVRQDGHIFVEGHHLVFAGGNNLGQSGSVSVEAQLFCGAGSTTPLSTTATTLDANGDFRFDQNLPSAPPDPCVDPVLLIVTTPATAGAASHWLAAGVPHFDLN